MSEPLDAFDAIAGMTWEAIRDRKQIEVTYYLKPGQKLNVEILNDCEKAMNGWITGMLRSMGAKLPRKGRLFQFDLNQYQKLADMPDGSEYLRVKVDFAQILGPRPSGGQTG